MILEELCTGTAHPSTVLALSFSQISETLLRRSIFQKRVDDDYSSVIPRVKKFEQHFVYFCRKFLLNSDESDNNFSGEQAFSAGK